MRQQGKASAKAERMAKFVALLQQGQFAEAVQLGTRLADKVKSDPEFFNHLGIAHARLGQFEKAARRFTLATRLKPDFAWAFNNLGTALKNLGKTDEACTAIRTALSIDPNYAEAHNNLGNVLTDSAEFDGAITHYRAAITADPGYERAHNNLCEVLEKTNQLEAFSKAVADAERHCRADDPRLLLHLGKLASREKRHADARIYLSKIPAHQVTPEVGIAATELLGKTCDRLGDYDAAFACFDRMNALTIESLNINNMDVTGYTDNVIALETLWKAQSRPAWADSPDSNPSASGYLGGEKLVFLIGFPRSGTTLLDTILRGHPEIEVIEEQPFVDTVVSHFGQPAGAASLGAMSGSEIKAMQHLYFDQISEHLGTDAHRQTIVDKFPLNLKNVGLIHRIFPQARFIFATRDPADCVLSCYMQNFALNSAMASFLSLEQSAKLYDAVMTLWCHYAAALPLQTHHLKYENLVDDLPRTVAPLIGFLGLEWDPALADFQTTARQRTNINTPSYNQVTQGLYGAAKHRWRRYETHLAPILPTMTKWAAQWGYVD